MGGLTDSSQLKWAPPPIIVLVDLIVLIFTRNHPLAKGIQVIHDVAEVIQVIQTDAKWFATYQTPHASTCGTSVLFNFIIYILLALVLDYSVYLR